MQGGLRGRSGRPLSSKAANALLKQTGLVFPQGKTWERALLHRVVGRAALPRPKSMKLAALRDIPTSLLRVESEVEEYLIEPLLRLAGATRRPYRVERQHRVGRKLADFAVLQEGRAISVVEAKLRVRLGRDRDWACCPDVDQARGYADALDCPYLLIDCAEVFCFKAGAKVPTVHFERSRLTEKALRTIRGYLTGKG